MSAQSGDTMQDSRDSTDDDREYVFKLYITGATPRSMVAVKNITHICETYLQDRYRLQVIDVYQQPQLAKSENIIAAPTLIKLQPTPARRLIGDLSETAKILQLLDIAPGEM